MHDSQNDRITRVLLVEDDESHAFLASHAISNCNVPNTCDVARDGLEALEMLMAAVQEDQPYDLVLLDLNLPRLDGRETLARMKCDESLRRTPVIVLTTSNNESDVSECYAQGAASYIMKPFDLDGLMVTMELTLTFWCKLAILPGRHTQSAA